MTIEQKAKIKFEEIEYENRTWISDFMRKQSIWDEILMNLCSYTKESESEEFKVWCLVMDLYNEKYKIENNDATL